MAAYEILPWDSEFFGFAVARIDPGVGTQPELAQVVAELRKRTVRLAYWLPVMTVQATQLAAQCGGTAVGGHARFERETEAPRARPGGALPVEPASGAGATPEMLALGLHAGRLSRFALDPRMPPDTVARMYGIWIRRSLSGEIADAVLAARDASGRTAGMVTLARDGGEGVIGLVAVAPGWQGRGIGRSLMDAAADWFARAGVRRARVTTQTENAAACALYGACGYQRAETRLVAHFWL